MSNKGNLITIQGANVALRSHLTRIADGIVDSNSPRSEIDIVEAIIQSGKVINAIIASSSKKSLVIRVEEAKKIKTISIVGNRHINTNDILKMLDSRQNAMFNFHTMKHDIDAIKEIYKTNNLSEPIVKMVRKNVDKDFISVKFRILEKSINKWEIDTPIAYRKPKSGKKITRTGGVRERKLPESIDEPDIFMETDVISGRFVGSSQPTSHGSIDSGIKEDIDAYSSSWTGVMSREDRARVIKLVGPRAIHEIETLIDRVTHYRFNDQETQESLDILRALHHDLGVLIDITDPKKQVPLLKRLSRNNEKLKSSIKSGAKIGLVCPALTIGVSHMLSMIAGVPIDSTMISTVFATVVAMPLVEQQIMERTNR